MAYAETFVAVSFCQKKHYRNSVFWAWPDTEIDQTTWLTWSDIVPLYDGVHDETFVWHWEISKIYSTLQYKAYTYCSAVEKSIRVCLKKDESKLNCTGSIQICMLPKKVSGVLEIEGPRPTCQRPIKTAHKLLCFYWKRFSCFHAYHTLH